MTSYYSTLCTMCDGPIRYGEAETNVKGRISHEDYRKCREFIRADEREKALDWRVGVEVRQILEGRVYADLRAKVMGLRDRGLGTVLRSDVLAFFPEEKP